MAKTRKPAHMVKGNIGRECIWDVIRRQKTFTVPDLESQVPMHISSVREYVLALEKAGYIAKTTQPAHLFVAIWYQLAKDAPTAPRVRKDGSEIIQGRGQENMWRAMRVLKEFSAVDIAITASAGGVMVSLRAAKAYCGKLCQAGYIMAKNGRFRFVPSMYTGPKPPMIQRNKQVYDPNLKKVVWPKEDN